MIATPTVVAIITPTTLTTTIAVILRLEKPFSLSSAVIDGSGFDASCLACNLGWILAGDVGSTDNGVDLVGTWFAEIPVISSLFSAYWNIVLKTIQQILQVSISNTKKEGVVNLVI